MREKKFIIPMEPIAWTRARYNAAHKTFFDCQKPVKAMFKIYLEQQLNDERFFEGPLSIDLQFHMAIPQSFKKPPLDFFVKAPDLDNLVKFVLDTMVGTIVKDDRSICTLKAHKCYDKNPKTIFIIRELAKNDKEKK